MSNKIDEIYNVIDSLLGPGGCPWDQKQTPETLCDCVIEEAFELVEAIRDGKKEEVCEELGDVLFLLLFITKLMEKKDAFAFSDVVAMNAAKMIRRHPHVFGETEVKNQEELLRNWEKIKRGEKKDSSVFSSLPKGLPPLLRAYRINSKAARVGFTWENDLDAMEQLRAEWEEFEAADTPEKKEEEFGDYLFTLAEVGRRNGIKANAALDMSNRKFLERFEKMEAMLAEQGKDVAECSLDELNLIWDEVK